METYEPFECPTQEELSAARADAASFAAAVRGCIAAGRRPAPTHDWRLLDDVACGLLGDEIEASALEQEYSSLQRAPWRFVAGAGARDGHPPSSRAASDARERARAALLELLGPRLGVTAATVGRAHLPRPLRIMREQRAAESAAGGPNFNLPSAARTVELLRPRAGRGLKTSQRFSDVPRFRGDGPVGVRSEQGTRQRKRGMARPEVAGARVGACAESMEARSRSPAREQTVNEEKDDSDGGVTFPEDEEGHCDGEMSSEEAASSWDCASAGLAPEASASAALGYNVKAGDCADASNNGDGNEDGCVVWAGDGDSSDSSDSSDRSWDDVVLVVASAAAEEDEGLSVSVSSQSDAEDSHYCNCDDADAKSPRPALPEHSGGNGGSSSGSAAARPVESSQTVGKRRLQSTTMQATRRGASLQTGPSSPAGHFLSIPEDRAVFRSFVSPAHAFAPPPEAHAALSDSEWFRLCLLRAKERWRRMRKRTTVGALAAAENLAAALRSVEKRVHGGLAFGLASVSQSAAREGVAGRVGRARVRRESRERLRQLQRRRNPSAEETPPALVDRAVRRGRSRSGTKHPTQWAPAQAAEELAATARALGEARRSARRGGFHSERSPSATGQASITKVRSSVDAARMSGRDRTVVVYDAFFGVRSLVVPFSASPSTLAEAERAKGVLRPAPGDYNAENPELIVRLGPHRRAPSALFGAASGRNSGRSSPIDAAAASAFAGPGGDELGLSDARGGSLPAEGDAVELDIDRAFNRPDAHRAPRLGFARAGREAMLAKGAALGESVVRAWGDAELAPIASFDTHRVEAISRQVVRAMRFVRAQEAAHMSAREAATVAEHAVAQAHRLTKIGVGRGKIPSPPREVRDQRAALFATASDLQLLLDAENAAPSGSAKTLAPRAVPSRYTAAAPATAAQVSAAQRRYNDAAAKYL